MDPERRARRRHALNGPLRPMPSVVTVSVLPSVRHPIGSLAQCRSVDLGPGLDRRGSGRLQTRPPPPEHLESDGHSGRPPDDASHRDDRRGTFRDRLAILDPIRDQEVPRIRGFEPQACLLRRVIRIPL